MTLAQMKAELLALALELDALTLDADVVRAKRRLSDLIARIP